MSPLIRRAGTTDIPDLTLCQTACYVEAFSSAWPPGHLEQPELEQRRRQEWVEFLAAGGTVWVAVADGAVVGFTSSGPSRGQNQPVAFELMTLYVRAEYYGSGLSDRLLQTSIGDAAAMLWMWDRNHRAQAYYARHGFAPDGGEKFYDDEVRLLRLVRAARRS